jgi:polyisoprenoid-binding protein YceI
METLTMKRIGLLSVVLALVAPVALAQTTTWKADPAHSEADFSIKHLTISNVRGRLGTVNATITYDAKNIAKSSVTASVDTTKFDSGEAARDTHVKSPDFFDVATYPTATFTSTAFEKKGNELVVTGNLTLHGVTKQVMLNVDGPTAPTTGMDKKPHCGWEATTTISRKDFGIGPKFPDAAVGDAVKITIELETVQQ